jgi:hypothetical protein
MNSSLKQYVADAQSAYDKAMLASNQYNDSAVKQAESYKTYNDYATKVNQYSKQ